MKVISDLNYDLSTNVLDALLEDLVEMKNQAFTLEADHLHNELMFKTRLLCYSITADTWYLECSHPKTVLSAILINSVHEYIMEQTKKSTSDDLPWLKDEFWIDLCNIVQKEVGFICETVEKLQKDEIMNLDAYHEKIKGDLNAIVL